MNETKIKFEDPTRADWVSGIGLIVIFLLVIGVGAFVLIPDYWWAWLLLIAAATLLLVLNQNSKYGCRCRSCEHEFKIGFFRNLISPHGVDKSGSWLRTRCPSCDTKGKVTVIRARKVQSGS